MDLRMNINFVALGIIVFATSITFLVLFRKYKIVEQSSQLVIPDTLPAGGIEIPVLETYSGIKGMGALNIAQNNFNPMLVLYNSSMEYRVLKSRSVDYSQIMHVRCKSLLFFNWLQFTFHNSSLTFSAHIADQKTLQMIAGFLRSKDLQVYIKT